MATSLQKIITAIKDTALLPAVGFKTVEEIKFNLNSHPDTELPRLFIRMENYDYEKFLVNSAEEIYNLELIIIIADSDNPITDLKNYVDTLLNILFNENDLFTKLVQGSKVRLIRCDMSNDKELFAKYGGEYASLRMQINNTNSFGGSSCL